jgi:hypothetical protein
MPLTIGFYVFVVAVVAFISAAAWMIVSSLWATFGVVGVIAAVSAAIVVPGFLVLSAMPVDSADTPRS